nr:hypothetical protein [Tanacetum cinerariifolium]
MGDKNSIRTFRDYSKPTHEGYMNTIELPVGNSVVPLRSDTIRLVQNGCSFHGLQSEDPNQHLKDFRTHLTLTVKTGKECPCVSFNFPFVTKLAIGLNVFQQDPSPHGRILLLNHGLILRTYSIKSLIMASTFGSKSKFFMTMSIPSQNEPLTNWPVNDPRDFANPVKVIVLPQDDLNTSDRRLIKLKNLVQRLMEAHFAPTQPTQVKKITTSCEIYSGPHDTQYCMKDPEQAFVEYTSSHSDEAGGKWYTFKPEQNNFGDTYNPSWKSHSNLRIEIETQQPEELEPTLKDEFQDLHLNLPVLKVLAHALIYSAKLDKYVERLELGKNESTFFQGEVPAKMEDPELFTLPCRLGHSKPFDTLADLGSCINIIPLYLFKKLKIRLFEETDHIFGLADGTKSYHVGIVKDVEVHIGKLKLLNDFYLTDMKKDPETPLLVGRGFLATANAVIDCRMAKIAVGEGITRESYKPRPRSDGMGTQTPYYARKDFLDCHLPREWEIARDAKLNPFRDTLVFRRMDKPPKDKDGTSHAKIRLIDPDGEEFTKTL